MSVVSKSINILEPVTSTNSSSEKRDYFLRVLSASGRGQQDLILTNNEENHAQSRRVVFKIRVRSIEEKKIEKIIPHG